MPLWVASVPRSTLLSRGRTIGQLSHGFRYRNVHGPKYLNPRVRYASAQVSPIAINVRPNVPQRNEELHKALSELSVTAEQYVNLSRVQLALRGLETEDAITRVAVLGLGSQRSAQQLARLLLADPLANFESWERQLEQTDEGDDRAVLLKHGDESDPLPPTPLYKTLSIPSRVLRSHNIEILVSTLNVDTSNAPVASATESSKDAVLVPKLQATSARGLPVPYPVHKTLILGEGLDSAVAFGRFTSDSAGEIEDMVKVAIDLPPPIEELQVDENTPYSVVNVDSGTEALDCFRESTANSSKYEHGWFRSGMPAISKWLVGGLSPNEPIKPAIKALVSSIADDVEANITRKDAQQLRKLALHPTDQQVSESILAHLDTWAEKSHTELRDQLDAAFSSKNWNKLSWWKLFWRTDDVSMITSEILERRWLIDAEKGGIFLAGRMNQSGFPEIVEHIPETVAEQANLEASREGRASPPDLKDGKMRMDISTEVRAPQPWPTQISASRFSLLQETIPPLQALSQRIILTTLSTTSLSSALSALLYVSMPTFSLFEASAVAVLGLTFSLRRMQKLWEKARETWAMEVREEGRKTLKVTEEMARLIVRSQTRKGGLVDEGLEERRTARTAAARVREALKNM